MQAVRLKWGRAALVGMLVVALLGCVLATGCSQPDAQLQEGLPTWTDEAIVTAQVNSVVDEFNARDYNALAARYNDDSITPQKLEESLSATQDEYGAFKQYGDAKYLHGESMGRSYATVIQKAEYENGAAEFRTSFFEDGSLAGFYFLKADK